VPFQVFNTKSRQPNDIDQLLVFLGDANGGKWLLLKEQRSTTPAENAPLVRMYFVVQPEQLAIFFHNREIEPLPANDDTRRMLSLYGIYP